MTLMSRERRDGLSNNGEYNTNSGTEDVFRKRLVRVSEGWRDKIILRGF